MKHWHAEWTCKIDMQPGKAASTRSLNMQHEDMDIQHGHAARTRRMDLHNGHVASTCSIKRSMDMQHGDAAWICCIDMQHGDMDIQHEVWTSSSDMQHVHAA